MTRFKLEYPYNLLFAICGEAKEYAANDLLATAQYLIHTLPPREQIVVEQYFRFSRTYKDIANMLSLSVGRVRQMNMKALRRLRHPPFSYYINYGIVGAYEKVKSDCASAIQEFRNKVEEIVNTPDTESIMTRINRLYVRKDPNLIVNAPLSTRAMNCLIRRGLRTLDEVVNLSCRELYTIRNLGKKTAEEVVNVLDQRGYNVDHLRPIGDK